MKQLMQFFMYTVGSHAVQPATQAKFVNTFSEPLEELLYKTNEFSQADLGPSVTGVRSLNPETIYSINYRIAGNVCGSKL